MKRLVTPALANLCAAFSVSTYGQFAKAEDAIKYRQSTMFIQSQHVGRLGAMASGRAPYDVAAAVANAETDKLLVAAKAGNLDALKAAMGPLGETCKACHDNFRNR